MMDNVDPILYGSYIFFGIGLVVTLIGAVTGLMANPESIKGIAIGLISMVVVFGIAYGLADGSDFVNYEHTTIDLSEGMSRFSGMLLYAIYILMGASIVTLVFSRIYSLTR
jgi:ribose/xylose/arabinose/galactoside ABC-type transport system permease subunit